MPKKKTAAKKTGAKKRTGAAQATMTKAAFVRSFPEDTPAEEVIAKGKAKGITLNKMAVYKNRSNARKAAKKSSTTAEASGKKAAANGAPAAKGRGDKKNLVLKLVAQHPDWSKKQIATAAKCTPNYVYSVLGESGQAAGKGARASASNGTVTAFYKAVKGVGGVPQAKELLANIEAFQNA